MLQFTVTEDYPRFPTSDTQVQIPGSPDGSVGLFVGNTLVGFTHPSMGRLASIGTYLPAGFCHRYVRKFLNELHEMVEDIRLPIRVLILDPLLRLIVNFVIGNWYQENCPSTLNIQKIKTSKFKLRISFRINPFGVFQSDPETSLCFSQLQLMIWESGN